jgi:ATP11 protein
MMTGGSYRQYVAETRSQVDTAIDRHAMVRLYHFTHSPAPSPSPSPSPSPHRRAITSPLMAWPIWQESGFAVYVSQWQDRSCLVTSLEEYQRGAMMANPHMVMTVYAELLRKDQSLALVRGDITHPILRKPEAQRIMNAVKLFYNSDDHFHWVENFNNQPANFDFNKFAQMCRYLY